jgi:hypothetical protein
VWLSYRQSIQRQGFVSRRHQASKYDALNDSTQLVVTIDFGSSIGYGESISAVSRNGLDCSITGSLKYDLTCLGSSLFELQGTLFPRTSRALLKATESEAHFSHAMIRECLSERPDLDEMWIRWKAIVTNLHIDKTRYADLKSIWLWEEGKEAK